MMNKATLSKELELHEGKELQSYICPAGYLTVGIGRNLEANPSTDELGRRIDKVGLEITEEECRMLLEHDIDRFANEVRLNISVFNGLSEPRQHVLIDMAFNLGTHGLLKFKKMLAAIQANDFDKAAAEMLDSKWARQVGHRATRLATMIRENREFSELT